MADGAVSSVDFHTRSLELRAVREDLREADFVASTGAVDTYGTILDPHSWKLDRFLRNPVVLWAHRASEFPIGRAKNIRVDDGELTLTIEFTSADLNADGDQAWRLVKAGFLRGISVGFQHSDARTEFINGAEVLRLLGCELREVSIVSVPSNPEALAKARTRAAASQQPPAAPHEDPHMSDPKATPASTDTAEIIQARTAQQVAERILDEKTRAYTDLEKRHADLQTAFAKTTADHEELKKRHAEVEQRAITQEVDALIGKKLKPAQREAFIALRTANKAQFDAIVSTLPETNETGAESKLQPGEQKRNSGPVDFSKYIDRAKRGA